MTDSRSPLRGARPESIRRHSPAPLQVLRRAGFWVVVLMSLAATLPAGGCKKSSSSRPRPQILTMAVDDGAAGGFLDDIGEGVAVDALGRILVTGFSQSGFGDLDMVIWRFNDDGTLDGSFGFGGIVVDDNAAGGLANDAGRGIALDASSRIIVAGDSQNTSGDFDMVVWRFTSGGALDATFGTGGVLVDDGAASGFLDDGGWDLAQDSLGRIVVVGDSINNFGDADMVIWRITTAGALDLSFGNFGIVADDSAAGGLNDDFGYDVEVDFSGRIVVTGASFSSFADFDMVVWRYNSDGSIDGAFGIGGIVLQDLARGWFFDDFGYGLTLDSLGRIVVAGSTDFDVGDRDTVIWRFDTAGNPDFSFGGQGWVEHDTSRGGIDEALSVTVDAMGRIVAAGTIQSAAGDANLAVWRYNPNGTLQSVAAQNSAAGGNGGDFGVDVAPDTAGGVYVAGTSQNVFGDLDTVLWRRVP